jgi:hypothetical protein
LAFGAVYDLAKEQAHDWWTAYNGIIAEFTADERASINGSSAVVVDELASDVEAALNLLNSMGTCGTPPESDAHISFSFQATMLYAFYVATTIGYGVLNVQTKAGKSFVMFFALIGMWIFGWAADSLTVVLQIGLASAARGLIKMFRVIMGANSTITTTASTAAATNNSRSSGASGLISNRESASSSPPLNTASVEAVFKTMEPSRRVSTKTNAENGLGSVSKAFAEIGVGSKVSQCSPAARRLNLNQEQGQEQKELTLEREYEEQSMVGQSTVGQRTVGHRTVGQGTVGHRTVEHRTVEQRTAGQRMVDDSEEEVGGFNSGSTTSSVEYSDADADGDSDAAADADSDVDANEDSDADADPLSHWMVFAVTLAAGMIIIFTTSRIFYAIENDKFGSDLPGQEWELFDAFWFVVITASTIGFGDMSLNWNRASATVVEASFISVGVVLFALPIGMLADFFGEVVGEVVDEVVGEVGEVVGEVMDVVDEVGELLGDVVDDAQAAVATGMVVDSLQETVIVVGGVVGEAGDHAQALLAKEAEETKPAMGKRAEKNSGFTFVMGSV